jgi:protein-tyrosine-phosphatase
MNAKTYNVLFVGEHNSARSLMAEAILNSPVVGKGRFRAFSAGTRPSGAVNPYTLEQIRVAGLSDQGLRCKPLQEFLGPGSPAMHFVFTLCDTVAVAPRPDWPGNPLTAHWGMDDPQAVDGPDAVHRRAFSQAFIFLYNRINIFASLSIEKLDRIGLQNRLDAIGMERA